MLFKSNFIIQLIVWFFSTIHLSAQHCDLTLEGYIKDGITGTPIENANLFVEGISLRMASDSTGYFQFTNICPQSFHLVISHIGCETKREFIKLTSDTSLLIFLDHHAHELEHVVIEGERKSLTLQNTSSVKEKEIVERSHLNLATLIENIPGVNSIKNGSSIAKPMIHGLYGNRLSIINNGIAQSGQQWGNDHAPEIDPLVANTIQVVKGVASLEYMGPMLGAVVLVKPDRIENEPHLHGKATYFYETNGRGHNGNLQLQQYSDLLAWKFNITAKNVGDKSTPNYYLTSTGNRDLHSSLQLEKRWNEKLNSSFFISTFNTEIGVMRGSHIGNLTDLSDALTREVPFFTVDNFSRDINAPRQLVNHHLGKVYNQYFINNEDWIEATFSVQRNVRKEFDVRRGNRTDIPSLSLDQWNLFGEVKYQNKLDNDQQINTGLQYNFIDNTNISGTGILPLIPDYITVEGAYFLRYQKHFTNWEWEIGGRINQVYQNVKQISPPPGATIITYNNNFTNLSFATGLVYENEDHFRFTGNIGLSTRNPGINELYSGGLHQGVSGIEEGNVDLAQEKSLKMTLGIESHLSDHIFIQCLGYAHLFNDYIYLQPGNEFRLTIRGSFPVFTYEQTNARILGTDLKLDFEVNDHLKWDHGLSFMDGRDVTNGLGLVNVPRGEYTSSVSASMARFISLENLTFTLGMSHVFQNDLITVEQDFTLPPPSYTLFNFNISGEHQLPKGRLTFYLRGENIFNQVYRDYLNRLRYFADAEGRSFITGINYKF